MCDRTILLKTIWAIEGGCANFTETQVDQLAAETQRNTGEE